ncbi:MAG: hypothetical protein IKE43_12335 [Coriobacteriales bacterium]|nr:hypothetical protein [Coriobacteriales bacterium]
MEIFRMYFYDAKKNRARSKGSIIAFFALFVIIMVGLLGGMFAFLSSVLCEPLTTAGMGWLYFVIMGGLAILLGIFGSVFNTYSGLYRAKDNDLLLSMPIPINEIMIARLLGVYLMGLMYSGVVIIPAIIVYWITVPVTFANVVGCLVLLVLISVFVLVLSCLIGWIVAKLSAHLKSKAIITTLIAILFIVAYYVFYFAAVEAIEDLINNAALYGGQIKDAAYGLYLFGSIGEGNWFAMLLFSAIVAAMFFVMWYVMHKSFLNIVTSTPQAKKAVYREKTAKQNSAFIALVKKELARFTSNSSYMLNCGLGILMLPLCTILLVINAGTFMPVVDQVFGAQSGIAVVLLCSGLCMLASMNDIAAPSVSFEGKSLWIARSLPVTSWQILRAKAWLQLLLTGIPMLLCAVCLVFILQVDALQAILFVVACLACVALFALWDLFLGVRMANLNWTNEITPLKQSGNILLAIFGSGFYAIAIGALYLWQGYNIGPVMYLTACIAVTAILSAFFYLWLKSRGVRLLEAL